ncbi:hypothetical protein M3O96_11315 [Aquiflexum sp. TKW24L]|uniref:hypothetical protein n=1 Tax=Aquiflexum sp. TKW24L TaxID=2942212 RepID=UPI0020C12B62|nr:hypothetical protein [Aquiflexum sp. TKW24L]MCL6259683.1 hypothetical protein [Aquiflexum sp. TKW24L]
MEEVVLTHIPKAVRTNNLKPSYPRAFYWLILINVVIDIFAFWSEPGGLTAILRVIILYAAFFYFLLIKKLKFEKNIYVVIFSFYVLLQLFIAVDLDYSLKISIQIITCLLMFFVGYALIKNEFDFYYYLKQFFWIYVVIIVNTIGSNIFKIGLDDYTQSTDYVVGGLNDLWNIYTYSLIILPLLILYKIQKKWLLYICGFLVLIFLMVSLKRIAILGVIFSSVIFVYFLGIRARMIKKLFYLMLILLLTSPLYSKLLINRIEIRAEQGRFQKDFYQDEGRYLEVTYLLDKFKGFENPLEVFFGLRAFDSRGVVGDDLRQFHVDYTLVAFTLGFFGLILYLLIHIKILIQLRDIFKNLVRNHYLFLKYKTHIISGFVLLFSSMLTSIGGQMYHVSFRVLIFMTLGGIIKFLLIELKSHHLKKHAYFNSLQSKF